MPHSVAAQRVGIEEKPPAPLSLSEWEKVREKSAQRADSQMPCAICQEDFKLEDQVRERGKDRERGRGDRELENESLRN